MRKERKIKKMRRGNPIALPFGAVITPVSYGDGSGRWANCAHQEKCLDQAIILNLLGFSCENCPLKGKPENVIIDDKLEACFDSDQDPDLHIIKIDEF